MSIAALDMIQSLKHNKSLRKNVRSFSTLKSALQKEHQQQMALHIPAASPEELQRIKKEIKHRLKRRYQRENSLLVISLLTVLGILTFLIGSYLN